MQRIIRFLIGLSLSTSVLGGCSSEKEVKWNLPTYIWSDDYIRCTAERVSSENDSIRETETVESSYTIVTKPKCENNGLGRYTATFTNSAFETQTMELTIDSIGHNWGVPTYKWNDDFTTCEAVRICQNDLSHKQTEKVNSTYGVVNEPTYEEDGLGRYTATFANSSFSTQNHDVVITKLKKLVFTNHETYYSVKADSTSISGNITIPSEHDGLPITAVDNLAFSGCSLITSITLPDSIIAIGNNAFYGCSLLKSISIPDSVTSIGNYAFNSCSSLQSAKLPNNKVSLGFWIFRDCISLVSVDFGNKIDSIGCGMFQNCSSLEEIDIPNSVIQIQKAAFSGCSKLKKIYIPDSVVEIGERGNIYSGAFAGCSSMENIRLSNNLVSISADMFSRCINLKAISIPNSVTSISNVQGIFEGCTGLRFVSIGDGIEKIPAFLFNECNISELIIGSNVKEIGEAAFLNSRSISRIVNKSSLAIDVTELVKIPPSWDWWDPSLNVQMFNQSDLMELDNGFECCIGGGDICLYKCLKNAESITIPNYVTKVESYSLMNLKSLKTLNISKATTELSAGSVFGCDLLETINYEGTIEEWSSLCYTSGLIKTAPSITAIHCSDGDVTL